MKNWLITDKGDLDALALVDGVSYGGKPHYSRQTPGARSFTRNGQNLVFITENKKAVWVTFRPTPGKAVRPDGLDCWECALFRNEHSGYMSSELIKEAVALSYTLWTLRPSDGFITFIKPSAVKSVNPGYCYKMAGWKSFGTSKDGKPRLRAPEYNESHALNEWSWHGLRGGKLRCELEGNVKTTLAPQLPNLFELVEALDSVSQPA